jgi:hypothetical protein
LAPDSNISDSNSAALASVALLRRWHGHAAEF